MSWQIRQCLALPPYGLGQHRSVTFDIYLSPTGEVQKLEDVTPKDRRSAILATAVERAVLRCQPYYNVPANPLRLTIEAP